MGYTVTIVHHDGQELQEERLTVADLPAVIKLLARWHASESRIDLVLIQDAR